MPLKLYKMDISPASCAAMMIFDIHNVPVEMIDIDIIANEHMTPEYLKKNPLHTIPLLEDDDLNIHDSHVILTYITDKYGKDDSWYPKDLNKRALVDQKLHFDVLLFIRMRNITTPAIFEGVRKPADKLINSLREMFDILEIFLSSKKFVAGDNMTLADISISTTMAITRYVIPIDPKIYPKIHTWFSFMEKQPFFQKYSGAADGGIQKLLRDHLEL